MPQEEVIKISTGDSAKSLLDLRRELKETQKELSNTREGTKEYQAALEKLGGLKDDIGDLRDVIGALNPEGKVAAFSNVAGKLAGGFQAATGAAALFGLQSEDVEKTLLKVQAATAFASGIQSIVGLGDAFKVLGTVIKSNPIFLIATVIISIGTGLFLLKDKIKIVGDAFAFFGEILDEIITGIKDFTDAIGLSSFALDDLKAKTKSTADANLKTLTAYYDNALKLAKANGEDTTKIEQEKLAVTQKYNQDQLDDLKKTLKEKGRLTKDESAEFTRLAQELANGRADASALEITAAKKAQEEYKKLLAERKKLQDDENAQSLKNVDANLKARQSEIDAEKSIESQRRADETKGVYDSLEEDAAAEEYWRNASEQQDIDASKRKEERGEEVAKISEEQAKKESEARTQIIQQGLNAAKDLSDAYFAGQLASVEKGSKAELEIRKKAFQVNKAFQIANATINGVQAVLQALASFPPPYSFVLAAISGVAAAAQIAKIAATKFDGGNTSTPSASASISAPNVSAATAPTIQPQTSLNSNGTQNTTPLVRTYVLAADVTDKQNDANRIRTQSKY